jgi:hypothetical protein
VSQLERTTFIYWPIEMHSKSLIWGGLTTWKNYILLLNNWMHSRACFARVFRVEGTTFIYWLIQCTSKAWFTKVFRIEITTFIYWLIECTPKVLFGRVL